MRLLVVLALVMWSLPAVAKPGAVAIPPLAVDVGAATPLGDAPATLASTELRVGASWASLYWKPTPFDVAIGYIGSYRELVDDGTIARSTDPDINELRMHGAYLELAYAIENHRHWRTFLGGRIETLAGDYRGTPIQAVGGALRLGAEVYSTGVASGGGGSGAAFFAGAVALGVYVEGTARSLPRELGPVGVGAGVSVRIPFILAIGG